jgi:DNA-binding XRE family transcriptional regulator
VPLPPKGDKTFVVPAAWIGAPIDQRLRHAVAEIKRLEAETQTQEQRATAIRDGLAADREAVTQLVGAVIARRLGLAARPQGARTNLNEACLAVGRRLAENFLSETATLDKVARWIAVSVSAWAAEDKAQSEEILARRLAYLLTTHAEDTAGALVELLLPPHRPEGYLEELLRSPDAAMQALPQIPPGTMIVLASGHFHDIREALYKNTFRKVDGTPWPTAPLKRNGASGYAQLRPAVMDSEPLLPEQRLQAWVTTMWRQQSELSDLDADGLDALCAIYLNQARAADDAAVADVDEILAMRGLKPKRGGQGRRGGYEPEQRAEMLKALSHIQNLWIDIGEVRVYEGAGDGRRQRSSTIKTLQSRPFIITDRMGQIRLDGYLDVERFIFRPGKAFAAFLFGAGRQTGLLFQRALQYDPVRRKWEKRLTRYTSWQWQAHARGGQFVQRFAVRTLLEAVGEELNKRYPAKTRTRLEKALSTMVADGVISTWRYLDEPEDNGSRHGWASTWLDAEIAIEAPDMIRSYYLRSAEDAPQIASDASATAKIAERVRHHRRMLGVSQEEAARRLGIRQGHFSKVERGRVHPSAKLRSEIEAWLGE